MTTIVTNGGPEADHGDGGHRLAAAAAWTDEQMAYAIFLKNACVRLEIIAVEIGVEPDLVGDFVRDALVIIHRARHTQARGRQGGAWIEAIAHNLGRKRQYGAALRRRRMTTFWSLWPFTRDHRHRVVYAEAQRLTSAVVPTATTI